MDAITSLLSMMSIDQLFLVLLSLLVAMKFISDLLEWLYKKLKSYFNIQDSKEKQYAAILASVESIKADMDQQKTDAASQYSQINKMSRQLDTQDGEYASMRDTIESQTKELGNLKSQISVLTERTQDSTRAYIIDKHHYFCYQINGIDDMSLQDLERRFMCYKALGGDTFIDALMEEIRRLPRITLEGLAAQLNREEG